MIYLDNALATRADDRVVREIEKYLVEYYGLPTSEVGHSMGVHLLQSLEEARKTVADAIGAEENEVIFTSGSTESDNIAIKGPSLRSKKKKTLLVSEIGRKCQKNSAYYMKRHHGFEVGIIRPTPDGFIDIDDLSEKINEDTFLVSIMHANHEIGSLNDLKQISSIVHDYDAFLHVDATYSFLANKINVKDLGIDLLTIDASPIYGPKGAAALYISRNVPIESPISGAPNEFGRRPGDPNMPAIMGFKKAIEIWDNNDVTRIKKMRDRLIKGLLELKNASLNGPTGDKRNYNNVNISFRRVEGEAITLWLDKKGIIVNTGSACFSPVLEPSSIILAMGKTHEDANGSVRFTIGKYNTIEEIDYTIEAVHEIIKKLLELSPI